MIKKLAIVGCGKIAMKHINAIKFHEKNKKLKLVAVCDNNIKKLKQIKIPYLRKYQNISKMLRHEELDIISILTPSGLHFKHFMQSVGRVKTIIIEKPMALKVSDGIKMVNACKKTKTNMFVVLQHRFNPLIKFLKKTITSGKLGKIFLTTIRLRWSRGAKYYNQAKWRGTWKYDGGVIANQCAHHIDLLQWISDMPTSVIAKTIKVHKGKKVEDTALVILDYKKKNKLALIEATSATRPKDIEGSISVLGTKGSVVLGGYTASKIITWDLKNISAADKNKIKKIVKATSNIFRDGHKQFYKHVIDSLKNKTNKHFLEGKEGLKSLKIINAIYKSSKKSNRIFLKQNLNTHLG